MALLWMKYLGFFRGNIIYTHPLLKCRTLNGFSYNVLLLTLRYKSLRCIIPSKIKSFYIRIVHFPITISNDFFDIGVCGPVIFVITVAITAFKQNFWAKLLVKWILEALLTKISMSSLYYHSSRHPFYKPDSSGE